MAQFLRFFLVLVLSSLFVACGDENHDADPTASNDNNLGQIDLGPNGPFVLTTQLGYGDFYVVAVVSVMGNNYNSVKVTFVNVGGDLDGEPDPIFLNPQNPSLSDMKYSGGKMVLNVSSIQMHFPTPEQTGRVILNASFTDIYGRYTNNFSGKIAEWTSAGPL